MFQALLDDNGAAADNRRNGAREPDAAGGGAPAAIGDIVRLGGVDWRVIFLADERKLVISEHVLERRAYHSPGGIVTWADSTLRAHLNGQFLDGFSEAERGRILETSIGTANNPWFGSSGGEATLDRVFILSLEETVMIFGDSEQLWNRHHHGNVGGIISDQYNGARIATEPDGTVRFSVWLRSPGYNNSFAAYIGSSGGISVVGYGVNFANGGVRPAMWLSR